MTQCLFRFNFFQLWADHRHKVRHATTTNVQAHHNSDKIAHLYCIHYWDIANCCNSVTTWSLTCPCAGCWLLENMDLNRNFKWFNLYLTSFTHIQNLFFVPAKIGQKKMFTKLRLCGVNNNKSAECDECGEVCLRWIRRHKVLIRGRVMSRFHNVCFSSTESSFRQEEGMAGYPDQAWHQAIHCHWLLLQCFASRWFLLMQQSSD